MADRATFIEGFAIKLAESGMQRMAARVFAALLTAPSGGYTAREIAEVLDVSAGAVSGATSYLTRTNMAERRRLPGERADRFDVTSTTWAEAMAVETGMIVALQEWLEHGVEALADDPDARDRVVETRDFFAFLAVELPLLVERWHAQQGRSRAQGSGR